ncbi:MAG: radical SAM protein, partial [Acidobacteriota bacterium]
MSRILLVNPPIYDFSAFDFWLKPYGLLRIAGYLRGQAEIELFDFLDRKHPEAQTDPKTRSDEWGRGRFPAREVEKPSAFGKIPRKFRRYGLREETFEDFLSKEGPFDFALIQTGMTYWYLGLKEVLATLKKISPATRTVFGGPYATICPTHARTLAPDLVIEGLNLDPLWQQIGLSPDSSQTALWESYRNLEVGVLKLSDGCPFRCTYCSVPQVYPRFRSRPLETAIAATRQLTAQGVENIVFYDDALLFKTDEILSPFLEQVESLGVNVNFHTPNALN